MSRLRLAIVLVFALGAFLRLYELDRASFAHDEAWRANWSHHGGLSEIRRFPPLQFAGLWSLQYLVGRSEWVLRLPYAVAGVACVAAVFLFTRRLADPWSAVLAAALAAGHPVLIRYSRLIKEFSVEALMCVVLLWAGWVAYQRVDRRRLAIFFGCSLVGLGCTFTGALITCAWLPVLAWVYCFAPKGRDPRLRRTFAAVVTILATAAGGLYVWYTRTPMIDTVRQYYSEQEPLWPAGYTAPLLGEWLVASLAGIGQFAFNVRYEWPPIGWCVATVQILAMAVAVGFFWKRCRALLVVLAILGLEIIVVGAMRLWPIGNVRTMTFLVPIGVIAVACGLWRLVRPWGWSPATAVVLGLALLVPGIRSAHTVVIAPQLKEHIRPLLGHISAHVSPGDAIFVCYGTSDAFEYYADIAETLRQWGGKGPARFVSVSWGGVDVPVQVQPTSDRGNQREFEERFAIWAREHNRVWFLRTRDWRNEREEWLKHLRTTYVELDTLKSVDTSVHLFTCAEPESPARTLTRVHQ